MSSVTLAILSNLYCLIIKSAFRSPVSAVCSKEEVIFIRKIKDYDRESNYADYYCEVCDKYIKPMTKFRHFKSNIHKELDKCEHIILSIEIPNIDEVDSILYSYNTEHKKN